MSLPTRTILIASAAALTFHALRAAEPAAAKPAFRAESAAASTKFALKNKSTFTLSAEQRAPFWPIGWTKRAVSTTQVKDMPKVTLDESAFQVTSILVGEQSLAVINGRAYSEGEFLRLPKGSQPIRIRVQRISDGSVTLQYGEQMLMVGLRRPELVEKPPETALLNDEK
jgi:hypothetical protein